MAEYRVHVEEIEAAANGDLHLLCAIQRKVVVDEVDTWVLALNGHRTMVLDGEALLAILTGPGTEGQKIVAILAIFKQEALAWGIDTADSAYTLLMDILPENWDGNVAL